MELSDSEFKNIVDYVKKSTGIELGAKRILVAGRLENYIITLGYSSFGDYFNDAVKSETEVHNMIDKLTTNHTYFWREPVHFEFLKNCILPELKIKERNSKDIRIWSAASSTGEEPYTLAMILNDFFSLDSSGWDKTLLATDISTVALEKAVKGIYLKEDTKVLPDSWRRRYFKNIDEDRCEIVNDIKNEVIYRQFNLMNPFPFKKKFHVVFIRNVMIYFNDETRKKLIAKISDYLEKGGYLIIGTTENIDRIGTDLEYVQPSVYRKK